MTTTVRNTVGVLVSMLALAATGPLHAGDPVAGKQKSATCVACHGPDGNSPLPANPRLAGQYADYLEHVLREYRSGARANAIMAGMSASLTDEDIEDLAAYFSSQEGLDILPDGPND